LNRKDILGIWIGQHESAKFWAGALNDLKSRDAKDVYLFCVDGFNGFDLTVLSPPGLSAIPVFYPRQLPSLLEKSGFIHLAFPFVYII